MGNDCQFDTVDISDEQSVYQWSRDILITFGSPDILINNAAILGRPKNLLDYSYDEFVNVLDVNVMGTFFVLKYFVPAMNARGIGTVINMSSGIYIYMY